MPLQMEALFWVCAKTPQSPIRLASCVASLCIAHNKVSKHGRTLDTNSDRHVDWHYLADDVHMELRHGRNAVEAHLEDTGLSVWVCCHCTLHPVFILLCGCLHSNNSVLPQQCMALQQWPSTPAGAVAVLLCAKAVKLQEPKYDSCGAWK